MNKQKEYFEKNIVPYRQKIRQLEKENEDLRLDRHTVKLINEDLKMKLKNKEMEIQNLLSLMNMSDEDRRLMLAREKSTQEFSSLLNTFSRVFR